MKDITCDDNCWKILKIYEQINVILQLYSSSKICLNWLYKLCENI